MPPFPPIFLRRRLFAGTGLGVMAALLPARGLGQPGPTAATTPDGFRLLRARPGTVSLRGADKPPTAIWGFDGTVPGPVLRVRRGEEVKIRLTNDLPEPTAIHWHGIRVANAMDGVPGLTQDAIAPGASFDYRFRAPDAGTFWFHAPFNAARQIARCLQGVLIVEEPEPVTVDQDVLLVFDDWRLTESGAIGEAKDSIVPGNSQLTVNGARSLDIPVKANERLRLRVLNAASASVITFRIDRHVCAVMALDGEPGEAFIARDSRLVLGPGNRVDLFVDMVLPPEASAPIVIETAGGDVAIARMNYAPGANGSAPRSESRPLPDNPLPERMDFRGALKLNVPIEGGAGAQGALRFTLAGRAASGPFGAPLFSIKRGRAAMLAYINRTDFTHSLHLHGHHFRLLDRLDDGWKPFWLDSLVVPPMQSWRLAFLADNPGKWLIDGRVIDHPETGTAAWFEVT